MTLPVRIQQDRDLCGIVIVQIVWSELEMPLKLTGIRIQREHAVAVQIVALALAAEVTRRRISRRPIQEIQFRIIGTCDPGGRTPGLPGISTPRFMAWLTGSWHCIKSP